MYRCDISGDKFSMFIEIHVHTKNVGTNSVELYSKAFVFFRDIANIFQSNAKEMPVYFNMSSIYIIDDAGAKFEVTVMLKESADGSLLLPYVILN
jgi:hypothetical protein